MKTIRPSNFETNVHSQPVPKGADTPRVWICDDDESIRFVLARALQMEGIVVREFVSAEDVVAALASDAPSVLVSDIRMGGMSGLELLDHVLQNHPQIKVLIMTAFSDLDSAVSSFAKGAFEYLPKPFDLHDALQLVKRALASVAADGQSDVFISERNRNRTPAGAMLGQASAMQELFRAIGRLSQSHATILITGETGTGKERVAQSLHAHSPRSKAPFVAINTAAIPKDLLESELFGHERGSFTGAQALRQGRFEQASGGTLFLDEIGDMPLELQTRLLRVLSEGAFYRVGGVQAVRCNVRVIAATHQDLEARVQAGLFREDLFHRLNVIRLRIPPLRERREDIGLLAEYFLDEAARQNGVQVRNLSQAALQCLQAYPFSGNVRELENICQWLTIMSPTPHIETIDLPPEVRAYQVGATLSTLPSADHGFTPSFSSWVDDLRREALRRLQASEADIWDNLIAEAEQSILQAALEACENNRSLAAQALGIGRNTITRKLQTP